MGEAFLQAINHKPIHHYLKNLVNDSLSASAV
ncbi:hypothetical protein BH11ARM2_BH11ARM2_30620 [soil metagenome]